MANKNNILGWWNRFQKVPAGNFLFSRMLGWIVPYSGSISCCVKELSKGHAVVELSDRRKVRNHLRSVHAIALLNLGELATGLSALTTIDESMRGIVVSIRADYLKKARGLLIARANFQLPDILNDQKEYEVSANIMDEDGDIVALVTASWLLGYR
ncbi:MAG: acyl-coenzyme A thioesterase PaaI-like protein [Gammaproteobacteria bacterium]